MRRLLLLAATSLALSLPAGAQEVIGLAELIDRASNAHPQVLQAAAGRDAARHSLRDAYLGLTPRANLVFDRSSERLDVISTTNALYRVGVNNFRNQGYTLEMVQPIFDGRLLAQLRGSHASLRRAREELSATRQRTVFELMQAYLTVLAAYDGFQLAKAEEDVLRRQMAEISTRARLGLANEGDLDEVDARLRSTEAQRMAAETALNSSFASLERRAAMQVGLIAPLSARIPMSAPTPATPDAWVREALAQNPDLRALDSATMEARAAVEAQLGAMLPRVDFRAMIAQSDTGGSVYGGGSNINDRILQFRLTVPIYNPDGAGTPIFAARSRLAASRYRLEDQRLEIEERVRIAFEEVSSNARRERTLVQGLEAQNRVTAAKRQRYRAGLIRLKESLDSERDLYQAQRDLLASRYNYLLNLMMLKRLTGDFAEADILYIDSALDRRATPIGRRVPGQAVAERVR